jgi:hypothetical protein
LGATIRNKYFESLAGKPAFIGDRLSTAALVEPLTARELQDKINLSYHFRLP